MKDDVRVEAMSPLRLQSVLLRYLSVVEYPRLAFWPGHNHPNHSLAPVKVTAYGSQMTAFQLDKILDNSAFPCCHPSHLPAASIIQ